MVGCDIRLKIEAGCDIVKNFEMECGMKLQQRDCNKLHFGGRIRDKMATCGIVSESQNLKPFLSSVTHFTFVLSSLDICLQENFSTASQVSSQCVEISLEQFGP